MTVIRQRREDLMDEHSTGIQRRGQIPGGLGVYWGTPQGLVFTGCDGQNHGLLEMSMS